MNKSVSKIVKESAKKEIYEVKNGDFDVTISTGSTLLDLAISGTRKRGGGLPGGIMVEVFGPSGSGKTVLLSEIAGAIQRQGGEVVFFDPEARLNKQFANMFDVKFDSIHYSNPDTVTEVFEQLRNFEPKNPKKINGIIADSLAALSTNIEMTEGDKMGMRRAKEFSEGFRKTTRLIAQQNLLMVCSNQVRINTEAHAFQEKYITPGGVSVGFYSSLRLQFRNVTKIKKEIKVKGKILKKVIGVEVDVMVYKSSIDVPYRTAPLIIIYDYGIDDIRANLQYLKTYTGATTYCIGEKKLGQSLEGAIQTVEDSGLEGELKNAVIDLWLEIQAEFDSNRKKKQR